MNGSILLVHNPWAGSHHQGLVERFMRWAADEGRSVEAKTTLMDANGGITLEFPAEKTDAVWVLGGDGTFNRVVNAMTRSGWLDRPVGLIPAGTANVLAAEFGFSRRRLKQASLVDFMKGCVARPLDLGLVNDTIFLMSFGTGLDAAVMGGVNARLKSLLGAGAYGLSILSACTRLGRLPVFRMAHSSGTVCEGNWFVAANASRYAGDIQITDGTPFDDVMECFLFRLKTISGFAERAIRLIRRRVEARERMTLRRGETITIDGAGDYQLDGEFMSGSGPLRLSFHPEKLHVFMAA